MLTTKIVTNEAPRLWNCLNGIISVYKPTGVSMNRVQSAIVSAMCRDLNDMEVRPPKDRVLIEAASSNSEYLVKTETNLADHVLVVGERYQPVDFKTLPAVHLGNFTSGVMRINHGKKTAWRIRDNRPIRVYHVSGKFGFATETHFNDSAVTLRTSFDHVHSGAMNSYLASLQASHQKKMFELCGVDLQTQAAFELAVQGPLRPSVTNIPLVYSMRCIDFRKPYFTIEIHAVNESEAYLGILIHEIGLTLKTSAHCTQIRCIRQAHFTLEDALLRRHWNLQSILDNMSRCRKIIGKHPEMMEQLNVSLHEEEKQ